MTIHSTPPDGDLPVPATPATDEERLLAEELVAGQPFSPEQAALEGVPAVSDLELEQQALAHPGADGDPATPE
jgi:hypothetical protein